MGILALTSLLLAQAASWFLAITLIIPFHTGAFCTLRFLRRHDVHAIETRFLSTFDISQDVDPHVVDQIHILDGYRHVALQFLVRLWEVLCWF
jgi:hypothetical protein